MGEVESLFTIIAPKGQQKKWKKQNQNWKIPQVRRTRGKPRRILGKLEDFARTLMVFFCMLYNALSGNKDKAADRMGGDEDIPSVSAMNSLDSPMTPCPSAVEYVTPVFAKNYQGV